MIFKKNALASIALGAISILFVTVPAFAHVVVTPDQVGIGEYQEFSISVPTEKEIPTTEVKLIVPESLTSVTPNVKSGWTINVVKDGDKVKEIDWTGGSIPAGQRDKFLFQTQAPATTTTLVWKAIQTYEDGSTVEWTHEPVGEGHEEESNPPYSVTKVLDDLSEPTSEETNTTVNNQLLIMLSVLALALSAISLGISIRNKK